VLAEIIASDVFLLVSFNHTIEAVIQNNLKAGANPKALAQLDDYKRKHKRKKEPSPARDCEIKWLPSGSNGTTRGLPILVARVTSRKCTRIF
jgi:hypothetical protein